MFKIIPIALAALLSASLLSGCSTLQKLGFGKGGSDEMEPASSISMGETEAAKIIDQMPVHLYFATEDRTKLRLEVRYLPTAEARKSVNNLATKIVEELIKGPEKEGTKSTIPTGTKLAAPVSVDVQNSTATVDLTNEFVELHPGGKTEASLTIYSIVNSLTELKEVQKVKFLINGKQQSDFKGNFQFDATFPRSAGLISKIAVPEGASLVSPTPTKAPTPAKSTSADSQETIGEAVPGEEAEATYLEIVE